MSDWPSSFDASDNLNQASYHPARARTEGLRTIHSHRILLNRMKRRRPPLATIRATPKATTGTISGPKPPPPPVRRRVPVRMARSNSIKTNTPPDFRIGTYGTRLTEFSLRPNSPRMSLREASPQRRPIGMDGIQQHRHRASCPPRPEDAHGPDNESETASTPSPEATVVTPVAASQRQEESRRGSSKMHQCVLCGKEFPRCAYTSFVAGNEEQREFLLSFFTFVLAETFLRSVHMRVPGGVGHPPPSPSSSSSSSSRAGPSSSRQEEYEVNFATPMTPQLPTPSVPSQSPFHVRWIEPNAAIRRGGWGLRQNQAQNQARAEQDVDYDPDAPPPAPPGAESG